MFRANPLAGRFDTILDVDNIAYVIHPKTGQKVWLTPASAGAKFRYLASWRGRLQSLISAAAFNVSEADSTPTGVIGDQRPWYDRNDNKKSYTPRYPSRYEEYLKSSAAVRQAEHST
jgi:hypothetical protein